MTVKIGAAPPNVQCPLQPAHPAIWYVHSAYTVTKGGETQLQFAFDHREVGVRVVISTDSMELGTFGERGGAYHHLSISAGFDKDGQFYPTVRPSDHTVNMVLDDFLPKTPGMRVYESPSVDDPAVRHFFRRVVT